MRSQEKRARWTRLRSQCYLSIIRTLPRFVKGPNPQKDTERSAVGVRRVELGRYESPFTENGEDAKTVFDDNAHAFLLPRSEAEALAVKPRIHAHPVLRSAIRELELITRSGFEREFRARSSFHPEASPIVIGAVIKTVKTLVPRENETSVHDAPRLEELFPMQAWRAALFEASQPHAETTERNLRLEAAAIRLEAVLVTTWSKAFECNARYSIASRGDMVRHAPPMERVAIGTEWAEPQRGK